MTDKIAEIKWALLAAFFGFAFILSNRAENELQAGFAMVCAIVCFATHSILNHLKGNTHG